MKFEIYKKIKIFVYINYYIKMTNIIITDAKLQVDKNGNDYISEDEANGSTLDDYLKMTKLNLDIDRVNLERAKFEEQKRMNRINANKPRKS